ncbi:hypothetical protein B5807_03363 [Epicoccum nigrum]|uniref:Uncharacterized protein n=1 Tax=Epicoccum nigrum TaxID=105696 RepID=A0A1Y2M725_EPING|nr:hypothetical protein B5807_03363 [Epicoccum nigrum]
MPPDPKAPTDQPAGQAKLRKPPPPLAARPIRCSLLRSQSQTQTQAQSQSQSQSQSESCRQSDLQVPLTPGFHTNPHPHPQSQSLCSHSHSHTAFKSRPQSDPQTPLTAVFHTDSQSHHNHHPSIPESSHPDTATDVDTATATATSHAHSRTTSLELDSNLAFHTAEEYAAEIAVYVESLARFWNLQDSLDGLEGRRGSSGVVGEGDWI